MKTVKSRGVLLALSAAILMGASSSILAETPVKGMKNCENALLGKEKFKGLPMAAFSVRPGRDDQHAHFTVRWDGLKADGHCIVDKHGKVNDVTIVNFDDGRKGNQKGGNPHDRGGFYYDTHMGKWRDPDGRVCHTCTPENGFPKPSHYRN